MMNDSMLLFASMVSVIPYCVARRCFDEMFDGNTPLMAVVVAILTFMGLADMRELAEAIILYYAALGIALLLILVIMLVTTLPKSNSHVQKLKPKHDLSKRDEDE